MATLTVDQMTMYAAAAGLPDPPKWGAIGMAESGGRTDVVNSIGCVGIWQINQPVHVGSHPQWTVQWLKDPANNARAAKVIFDAQGYSAWEAYTGPDGKGDDGPWRQYYTGSSASTSGSDAQQAGWEDDIPGVSDIVQVAEQIGRIAQATAKGANWLSDPLNWVRIGYVAAGALLVGVGLTMVVRDQTLSKAAKTVGAVVGSGAKKVSSKAKSSSKAKATTGSRPAAAPPAKKTAAKKTAAKKTAARRETSGAGS